MDTTWIVGPKADRSIEKRCSDCDYPARGCEKRVAQLRDKAQPAAMRDSFADNISDNSEPTPDSDYNRGCPLY